jgi:hypothetical protein
MGSGVCGNVQSKHPDVHVHVHMAYLFVWTSRIERNALMNPWSTELTPYFWINIFICWMTSGFRTAFGIELYPSEYEDKTWTVKLSSRCACFCPSPAPCLCWPSCNHFTCLRVCVCHKATSQTHAAPGGYSTGVPVLGTCAHFTCRNCWILILFHFCYYTFCQLLRNSWKIRHNLDFFSLYTQCY